MSPSRRTVIGTAGVVAGSAVLGYRARSPPAPSGEPPAADSLAGETLYLDDGLTIPATDAARTDDPAAATVAVYPAGATAQVAERLAAGTPAAAVGPDALGTLLGACDRLDARYGFASRGWGPETLAASAVPRDGWVETHVFVGATMPRDLPWVLGETLNLRYPDCSVPLDTVTVPDDATFGGLARIRGHTAVGGFDRRDRVHYRQRGDGTAVYVDTEATVRGGPAADGDDRYRADTVELSAEFDAELDAVGPGAQSADGLTVTDRSDTDETRQLFTAASDATRASFTACSRRRVVTDSLPDPFEYVANARVTWRDPRFLRADDTFTHHTPGAAFWTR